MNREDESSRAIATVPTVWQKLFQVSNVGMNMLFKFLALLLNLIANYNRCKSSLPCFQKVYLLPVISWVGRSHSKNLYAVLNVVHFAQLKMLK